MIKCSPRLPLFLGPHLTNATDGLKSVEVGISNHGEKQTTVGEKFGSDVNANRNSTRKEETPMKKRSNALKITLWALTAFLCGLAAMAFAQDKETPKTGHGAITAEMMAATQAYWTPERMANAKPMPLPTVDPAIAAAVSSPLRPAGPARFSPAGGLPKASLTTTERSPSETSEMLNRSDEAIQPTTSPFSYEYPFTNYRPPVVNAFPYAAVGKLFFVIPAGASEPAGDYVCSASVFNNAYSVITARHCVFDYATGITYNSWVFYPGYNSGPNAAYGNGWTPNQWITWVSGAATFDYDIAMFQMHDNNGTGCNGSSGTKPVGDYTSWFGWYYGGDFTERQWDVFGYPAAAPFAGAHLWQDEAATGAVNPLGYNNVIEIGNPQTGGTSGGPWIIGLNPLSQSIPAPSNNSTGGGNFINGLNSFKWTSPSHPYSINGPEFEGYNFDNLLTDYNKLSCP